MPCFPTCIWALPLVKEVGTHKNSDQGWTYNFHITSPLLYWLSYKARREQGVGILWTLCYSKKWSWIMSNLKQHSTHFFHLNLRIISWTSSSYWYAYLRYISRVSKSGKVSPSCLNYYSQKLNHQPQARNLYFSTAIREQSSFASTDSHQNHQEG